MGAVISSAYGGTSEATRLLLALRYLPRELKHAFGHADYWTRDGARRHGTERESMAILA
jgi:hypothetical protein